MITRIELKNFMSHAHTVIEPSRGLTVITGPNNCGKSAIVSALQILCYNDDSTYVTRHGEKECSIKVFTDDGHEIEWQRNKNKSTKYIIDGNQHDRLGRGGTPDVLHEILKIQRVDCDNQDFDVHFGGQKQPVFLLNDSPRAAAQFFASSSDANSLITMQTRHKQKIRENKSTKKRLTAEFATTEQQLETLAPVPEILDKLELADKQYKQIVSDDEEIVAIHNQTMAIQTHTEQQRQLAAVTKTLQPLTAPPILPPTEPLDNLIKQIQQNESNALLSGAFSSVLAELNPQPTPVATTPLSELIEELKSQTSMLEFAGRAAESLREVPEVPELLPETQLRNVVNRLKSQQQRIESFESLLAATSTIQQPPKPVSQSELDGLDELVGKMSGQNKQVSKLREQLVETENEIGQVEGAIEDWVASNPACPTCGGALTAKQVIDPDGAHRHD